MDHMIRGPLLLGSGTNDQLHKWKMQKDLFCNG